VLLTAYDNTEKAISLVKGNEYWQNKIASKDGSYQKFTIINDVKDYAYTDANGVIHEGNTAWKRLEGGAGIHSLDPSMPAELPERLEAGTLPLPAIAGLLAGIRYVRRIGTQEIHLHECALAGELLRRLNDLPDVTVYDENIGSVVTFNARGYSPAETGAYLASRGICVRTGYHCAPLAHRTAGSFENGSVRAGFSWFNKMSDVRALADALSSLCRK
jgi:selenocysteine lyase/cysteine desulfurase